MQTNETKIICPMCDNADNDLQTQLLVEDNLLLTYSCPHCKHWFIMDIPTIPGVMTEMG